MADYSTIGTAAGTAVFGPLGGWGLGQDFSKYFNNNR